MKHWSTYLLIFSLAGNLIWLVVWWSHKHDTTPIFHPFDVNFHVTETSLIENGYEIVPVDVPMLELRKGDTTIAYSLDYYCRPTIPLFEEGTSKCINTQVVSRSFSIRLDTIDKAAIEKFIEDKDARIVFRWDNLNESFWVQHEYSSALFHCYIDTLSIGKYELRTYCNFVETDRNEVSKRKKERIENNAL
jgi:hypothetical protein